jgi:hypothetical protein
MRRGEEGREEQKKGEKEETRKKGGQVLLLGTHVLEELEHLILQRKKVLDGDSFRRRRRGVAVSVTAGQIGRRATTQALGAGSRNETRLDAEEGDAHLGELKREGLFHLEHRGVDLLVVRPDFVRVLVIGLEETKDER